MLRNTVPAIRPRIVDLQASRIRDVSILREQRPDVIPLWFGEPDEPTPDFICAAAKAALDRGETFYAANRGIPELRESLAAYMSMIHAVPVGVERITVTASAMNAIMIIMECLVDPGDNVVLVTPLWPNLAETVHIMGGETRPVPLDAAPEGWSLDLGRVFAACDRRTRAVVVNSPGNPTGWMMTADEQRTLLAFCRERGIWLVADEVYNRIVYDRLSAPSFIEISEPEDRLLVVNSFSKSWSMTGWRLGWITHPENLGLIFEKMNEFNIAGPTTFAQCAGVVALREGESFIARTVARYGEARNLVVERLRGMAGVELTPPGAAFFAVDGMSDSLAFAKRLVLEHGVGLAPGIAFGPEGEGRLRLCFAATLPTLDKALDRLEAALEG